MSRATAGALFVFLILQNLMFVLPAAARAGAAVSPDVVISQVYGGGGNTNAPYRNDFIELFNRGAQTVSVAGWTVQYNSATGANAYQTTALSGSIAPGKYYLVQQAAGAGTTLPALPAPDATGTIAMSGTAGRVALVSNQTALAGNAAANAAGVVDFVGYGTTANVFEGSGPAPAPSNTTSDQRAGGGCTDTDQNGSDFTAAAPAPRNSATAANSCGGGGTNPTGTGAASPSLVAPGATTLLTVTVTPGTNPAAAIASVTGDLSLIGGAAAQTFYDNGTNGDATAGDNIYSYNATVAAGTGAGAKTLPVTITDAQNRTGTANIALTVTGAPAGIPTLPLAQDWSNTALISADNDWSQVPGIVGYRGDDLTTAVGADPQTILADGAATPVNVVANQTDPNAVTSGGNYEFELPNPTVAFQGSGTADAPHLVVSVDTTNATNVTVSYNLRDIESSADNAIQPVALQYRVGNAGAYTNVPAAYVADATGGPSQATLVTPVAVVLPQAASNQPLVQLRIITANAVGNDEFVGVDDLSVVSNGTVPLSASGSATPNQVAAGATTLLKVSVAPATNPGSTGIVVTGNLSSIGGSNAQTFYDDGTNGDQTAGDNVFSYSATVPANASGGARAVTANVSDAQGRTASATINLTVAAAADPSEHLVMGNPSNATADVNNPFNYLLPKSQYVVGYHRDRAIPNWVSWHLDSSWIGGADRQDDFRPDESLPAGWYRAQATDYNGSVTGFDRGHHTPSADRTRSVPDNSATFLMTNMMPQAAGNNQGPWEKLETFSRSLVGQGNELYIVAAGVGLGGVGSSGVVTETLAGGKIAVPSYTWKVILVLPVGDNDAARVDANTRTIAVIMPNNDNIRPDAWQKYLATVDQVEALTGYDFFSEVPVNIQNVIESRLDAASNTAPQSVSAAINGSLDVTAPNTTLTGNATVTGDLRLGGSTLTTAPGVCLTLAPGATVTRISGYVNGCVIRQFDQINPPGRASGSGGGKGGFFEDVFGDAGKAAAPAAVTVEYPVGTQNGYSPVTATVTSATAGSTLAVTAKQGAQPNVATPAQALRRYWTLTETGALVADLTFKYLDADVPAGINENNFTLQRYENGAFTQVPATINQAANTATASGIGDFSDWTLLSPLAPTAAGVSVGGRVVTPSGVGLAKALVTLVNARGETRTVVTGRGGAFVFAGVSAGETYVIAVKSKRYQFAAQIVSANENLTELVFAPVE